MNERRSCPRQRVFKSGTIEFNRAGGITCLVRNVSMRGACLEVESLLDIPDTFTLAIKGDHDLHRCRMVWRSAKRMGVAYQ